MVADQRKYVVTKNLFKTTRWVVFLCDVWKNTYEDVFYPDFVSIGHAGV